MRKYFIYAIGEIVLVVIGILIALQINTWNNDRIDRKLEKEYIRRIAYELGTEVKKYEQVQAQLEDKAQRLSRIVQFWHTDQSIITDTSEFMSDFMSAGTINPWYREPVVWTQLVQSGDLKLIRDQKLVDLIFTHYNSVKNVSDNYADHPMDKTNEARNLMPPILLENDGRQYFREERVAVKRKPSDRVLNRIIDQRHHSKDLYTTLATISSINAAYLKSSVRSANEILEYIRTTYDVDDE